MDDGIITASIISNCVALVGSGAVWLAVYRARVERWGRTDALGIGLLGAYLTWGFIMAFCMVVPLMAMMFSTPLVIVGYDPSFDRFSKIMVVPPLVVGAVVCVFAIPVFVTCLRKRRKQNEPNRPGA